MEQPQWFKSSRSGTNGSCVEAATNLPGRVLVRDSKHPAGGHLTVNPAEWSALIRFAVSTKV